jgi:replicative DNA helicase
MAHHMTTETEDVVEEYAGLVLEDQLLDHMATPAGCRAIWKERLSSELIGDSDDGIRTALEFVISYMDEYREPPSRGVLEEETGYDEFDTPIAPIGYVITKLRERYQRQQMKRVITTLGRNAGNPEEALRIGLSEFNRIRAETADRKHTMDSSEVAEVVDKYHERLKHGAIQGVTFGFEELDKSLGGLKTDELTFIIARPKRYKSWQLLWSATAAVWTESRSVVFDTLEMPPEEMMERYTCIIAGVSYRDFKLHNLSPAALGELDKAARDAFNNPNKIYFRRPPRGERTVQQMMQEAIELGAEALYIDQLSFIESVRKASVDQRHREVSFICEDLKDATQHMPIYVAAQFNREAAGLNEMADLSKIGLSDSIGQVADTILGVHATKDMKAQNLIHMGVIESRSYEPTVWEMSVDLSKDSTFKITNVV